jgi:hypothetical protein
MQKIQKIRLYSFIAFRALLLAAGVGAILKDDWLNFALSLFALILTFLPTIIEKRWDFSFPSLFEILILIFIYLSVFSGTGPLVKNYWWCDILLNALSTVVIGAIVFSLVYLLFLERRPHTGLTPAIVACFSFCLSFTIATIMEISVFSLGHLIGFYVKRYEMLSTAPYMVSNLFLDLIVTLLVALSGYVYIRYHKGNLLDQVVKGFLEKNPWLFKQYPEQTDPSEDLLRVIGNGEGNKLEFKSTLRTNLHTSKPDKRIEHAVMKTIVAYLNSDGGCLLVGVADDGTILGIEADNFQNNDKFNRHFTNMFGRDIGNEFLPYIKAELVKVKEKFVLKVDCNPSDKPVFLKEAGEEEFYIRSSAATIEISGSKLIDYINSRFKI